ILGGSPNEPEEIKKGRLKDEEEQQVNLRACENLEKILLSQIERLKTEPISDRELERIKKLNHRDFMERLKTNESLAMTLATTEVQTGWPYLLSYLDRIDKITPGDIQEVAKRIFTEENRTTVFVIPGGKPDKPPVTYEEVRSLSGSSARVDFKPETFTNRSKYPTPQGWKHPLSFERKPQKIPYEKAEVSTVDGVPVFYLPDLTLPLVDLTFLFRVGSVDVSDGNMGLAQILSDTLIQGGAGERSPQELAMVLDENAIRLSFSVNEEDTVVKLSVLKEDWDKGLGLLLDVLTRPRFEESVVQVSKEQILTALRRQGEDARSVSRREATIWHFRGHDYGRDPLTALETIPRITRDQLGSFLKRYLVPSNLVVAVAGDIEKSVVLGSLERFFRSLPQGNAPERNLSEPPQTPPVLALVHKPGQVQSQVSLALRSVRRTDPDFWKLSLLVNLFGGGDSLLYTRLREDLGLVYAAYFVQSYKWKAGTILGYIGCKGDRTSQALEETVKIMSSLHHEVPAGELEQKRMDVLNSFVFNVDTPYELVETYARYRMRGEPLDTLDRIQEAYIQAKKDELESLSSKYLDPRLLQIVVVGDKMTPVRTEDGKVISLEEDLKALARKLDLPYKEIPLR
ncbi:MAG: M16 family metallopeptidase, partial [Deltaproteobacteria bacterium]